MLYHASPVKNIVQLEPRISNHGIPLIYFSRKKENVLVYLSNAVEKYCKETGFEWYGNWSKWGPYGFTKDKIQRLVEYYPNALIDTYKGVSAYIYSVEENTNTENFEEIPDAVTVKEPARVYNSEFIPDAYSEILKAEKESKIVITRYEEMSDKERAWLQRVIPKEYENGQADYRYFLMAKFPNIIKKYT